MLRYKLASHADILRFVVCSSLATFTSFSRVLPTSRMVNCASKSIERVVYCLNKDYFETVRIRYRMISDLDVSEKTCVITLLGS